MVQSWAKNRGKSSKLRVALPWHSTRASLYLEHIGVRGGLWYIPPDCSPVGASWFLNLKKPGFLKTFHLETGAAALAIDEELSVLED
jgi:hypothetical protein